MVKITVKTPRAVRRAARRKLFESLLGGVCVSCRGDKNLEFDHVIPEDKSFNLATSCMEYSLETILPELQKCQLLCKSCHRRKTASDRYPDLPDHGIASRYSNGGCRCDSCKKAWAKYMKKYNEKYSNSDIERRREQRRRSSNKYYARKRSEVNIPKML